MRGGMYFLYLHENNRNHIVIMQRQTNRADQTERQRSTIRQKNRQDQVMMSVYIQKPIEELRQEVEKTVEENEALELKEDGLAGDDKALDTDVSDEDWGEDERQDSDTDTDDYEVDTYAPDPDGESSSDDYGEDYDEPYFPRQTDPNEEHREPTVTYGKSFYETLMEQVNEFNLTDHEKSIMVYIIGSLDDSGFLSKNKIYLVAEELDFKHGIETSDEEVARLVGILKQFEPRGVGAENLQECLLLQLRDEEKKSPYKEKAIKVVERYFDDFMNMHWDKIQQRLKVDDNTFNGVMTLLTRLNPKPGSAFNDSVGSSAPAIVPDFYVHVDDYGNLTVTLNDGDIPELRVASSFLETVKLYKGRKYDLTEEQRGFYTYVKDKVDSANSFLNILKRRNETLLLVMRSIARRQRDFFINDEDENFLHPMTLKDVAEEVGVDISTVSRVTANKYVQAYYANYPLRFFFSNAIKGTDGEDDVSTRKLKVALKEIIDSENKDKPLSDEALKKAMEERSFAIARRTIAKYREQMGIPPARLRKGKK